MLYEVITDAVEVRWKLKNTPIEKKQRIIVMQATRNRLLMMLAVAPEEMKVVDIVFLSKGAASIGDWEIIFRVPNLYGLKKIDRHFSRSGLRVITSYSIHYTKLYDCHKKNGVCQAARTSSSTNTIQERKP